MKKAFLCFVLCFSSIFGAEIRMKDRLNGAENGDYIVTEANKMITLLAIRSITPDTLLLEEISAPTQNLKELPSSWAHWIKEKAPGHTSWSMIEIDLKNNELLECFSFSRSSWIHLSQNMSLFANLLQLPLKPLPKERQKKIGPPPMAGEPDFRKVWAPPLVFEGKKLNSPRFEVYETIWPEDGSELSQRQVTLYFDKEKRFPLPFWVQGETSHITAALRTIDSGKNLPVVHRQLPRRIPEFIGIPLKSKEGLRLNLKSPKYYKEFELFAIDVTLKEKKIHPINHTIVRGEEEWLTVQVAQEDLFDVLESNHSYTWLLVPTGYSGSYTQTTRPFVWIPEKS
ncbi:MAG: hypothetical protein COT85_00395 [Chlamydiae bacterium CG10_big_fil_rev_8_21_14_0_10_42_34]|nr:MAG: hypothetical protein COT85_00395 [Chlamydiae bacterium CG10_big_fil_rev_8_21_14_0_10_42_34]